MIIYAGSYIFLEKIPLLQLNKFVKMDLVKGPC